jgi:hypothetical protein
MLASLGRWVPFALQRQNAVDLGDDGSALPDGGGDALGRSRTHVADGEHAGQARLQRKRRARRIRAIDRPRPARQDEAPGIAIDAILQPSGIWVGADEQEKVAKRAAVLIARDAVTEYYARQSLNRVALKFGHFCTSVQLDVGQGRDAVD